MWVLADARAGTANQALSVAEALGLAFTVKPLRHTGLAWLPNAIVGASLCTLAADSRELLTPPWPGLVIAAGRRAAPVARWIRRQAHKHHETPPFLVQIMFPGWRGLVDFGLVAVPNHDRLRQTPANVLRITGAPHRITPARLAEAAERWRDRFSHLPRPRIACLVGGSSGRRLFTAELARTLAERTASLARGGSVLLTTSRRTGPLVEAALRAAFAQSGVTVFAHEWSEAGGDNPYPALLAWADAVVVTGDSMSMCTEACAQPGPVFIFAPSPWVSAKHARLHGELFALGHACPLPEDGPLIPWRHMPFNPVEGIVAAIRVRL